MRKRSYTYDEMNARMLANCWVILRRTSGWSVPLEVTLGFWCVKVPCYIHVCASELKWNTFRKFGAFARIEEADPLWKALGKVSIFLWLFGVIRLRLFRVICRCIESAFRACASPLNWNSLSMKADESSTSDKINLWLWLHNNWKTWLTAHCSQQTHVVGKTVSKEGFFYGDQKIWKKYFSPSYMYM